MVRGCHTAQLCVPGMVSYTGCNERHGNAMRTFYYLLCSDRMEECAEKVLLKDMEVFSELDITTKLWRTGHYPIVGALRSRGQ